MNTIFRLEVLYLTSKKRVETGKRTLMQNFHRGYYSSLSEAEQKIRIDAAYNTSLERLGYYVTEYPINPKSCAWSSKIKKYSYAANGEPITSFTFDNRFDYSYFKGADALWKVGDMVLFEELGYIQLGHILKTPYSKQWFAEHAEYVEQFYHRLRHGEMDEEEYDHKMKLENVYYISSLRERSISFVNPANIFTPTFPISPDVLTRFSAVLSLLPISQIIG